MPARKRTSQTSQDTSPAATENTEEIMPENPDEHPDTMPSDIGEPIVVNVALAIHIVPERWTTKPVSQEDMLTQKIQAEKGMDEVDARKLAVLMIENGLGDLVITQSSGASVNAVRREIREHVLSVIAGHDVYRSAGAHVELNEARRTNHKPQDA